jgi:predicted HNH restriction endonuclease
MGENYQFDPLDPEKGLVCLCSNYHSMIHRGGHYEMIDGERKMVPMTLKKLQDVYNERNKTE